MTPEEVEAKFRQLEGGSGAQPAGGVSEIDEELQALKKKIRIGT
jgi:hypothetical protein